MLTKREFYINGRWVKPKVANDFPVIDPSTEQTAAIISLGSRADVDDAIAAAKSALSTWSQQEPENRLRYCVKILEIYTRRVDEMAECISLEMGAPIDLARSAQAAAGAKHLATFIEAFKQFKFLRPLLKGVKPGRLAFNAIGVVGLITPWNWPMNQVSLKVVPALLAGCTIVLKPSELAPLSSLLFAEIIHEAGVPAGVFNLVNGTGETVGTELVTHEDVAMISFTGSTRAGKIITKNAADTLKRVCLELGGKGANLVFADSDEQAVERGVRHCFNNSGQSCNAPTRMLVERSIYDHAKKIATKVANETRVNSGHERGDHIGPVISQPQFNNIQDLIKSGIDQGATLLAGGLDRPGHLSKGYFVRPTVFADVTPGMRIFREEIFGPVLTLTPFDSEAEAIQLANDTVYGLTNYIQSSDADRCTRIALQLNSGMVQINGIAAPAGAFFGGIKQSGRAREGGHWGIEEFLDTKAISV